MSDKEVRVRITGDISDLLKKLEKIKDAFDDLGNDSGSNKAFKNLIDDLEKVQKETEAVETSIDDLVSSTKKLDDNTFEDMADSLEKTSKQTDEVVDRFKEFNDRIADLETKNLTNMTQELKDIGKASEEIGDSFKEFNDRIAKLENNSVKNMTESMKDFNNQVTEVGNVGLEKVNEQMQNIAESGEEVRDAFKKAFSFIEDISLNSGNLFGEGSSKGNSFLNNITEGFISGSIAGEKMASSMEGVAANLKDAATALGNMRFEELKQSVTYFDNLNESITDTEHKLKAATGQVDKLNMELGILYSEKHDAKEFGTFEDVKAIQDQIKALENYRKKAEEVANAKNELNKRGRELGATLKEMGKGFEEIDGKMQVFQDNTLFDAFRKANKAINEFSKGATDSFEEVEKAYKNFVEVAKKEAEDFGVLDDWDTTVLKEAVDFLQDKITYLKKYREEVKALEEDQRKLQKVEQDYIKEFDEQEAAYERLSNKIRDLLADEEKSVLVKEKVAKAFEKLTEAMVSMGAQNPLEELKEVDNVLELIGEGADDVRSELKKLMDQAISDAEEYRKSLSLVSYDRLKKELDNFGAALDDKTTKMLNFKHMQDEMDDATKRAAYSILNQVDALKKYADESGFKVIEKWDDATEEYTRALEGNADAIKRQREELQKNQKILEEYFRTMKDAGKEVADRFFDDNGKFNMDKYIREYENFGMSLDQLTAKYKAYKQQILENLKYEKENADTIKDSAKANLDKAKATKDAIQAEVDHAANIIRTTNSMEELQAATKAYQDDSKRLAEAIKEVAKAEQEFAEASERSEKADEDRIAHGKELIEVYNKMAKKLRELGIEIKDITKNDIGDRSLASMFNDIFPDENVPKKFKDYVEDIKAMFTELNDLELGNAGNILKDIGKGLVDMIPADIKAAAGVIGGISTALYKLYDAGKQQFFQGLSGAGDKLKSVMGVLRDFGQEARDAFENITDTQLDLSSLMELGPNFEYDMAKVGAIAGSNKRQLEELTRTAEHLGGVTQYTASDVAEAFQYMAMAGYDTEEMLSSINGTLSLSIASGTGLAETTDIVTDYMTALGLEANSTSDFVDKLAVTVTSSNTNVKQYGMSMKQVASQAGALGITMTDLSTAIGLQANAGVKGAKAGTALKNVLANMAAPTEKQAAALEKLGFAANETGSYFKLTENGAVDLEATIKQLMTATDNMTKSQKAAVLAQLAGREALPGLMALLSQGAEGWDELSATIENSTGKVQYWNECMSLAGKSGKEATAAIDNMKEVFAEVEAEALEAGLSSQELSHAIAVLGDDGKVSSDNIRDLISVIDSMNTATGEAEEKWRALDKAGDDFVNTGYDYDATIAKITADTTGLSQAKKEAIKSQLDENMTLEEANAVLKEYGLTAERVSFSTLEYADKLEYLRSNLKGCSDEEIKAQLANLGLADSFDEVSEVVKMSDKEFKAYKQNLETVKGMAEQLAEAMDETTKASLLNLASAIENVCIAAFNKIKPALKGAVDAVNEFFDTWHNGQENKFTFDGFEKGLAELANKIRGQKGNIEKAVTDLFSGLNRVINGGTLDSLLDMGTSVVQSICKGIQKAKDNGSLDEAIDGAIKKICNWVKTNGPTIEEAGKTIIDAVADGIENNEGAIRDALDTIMEVMNSWASSSSSIKTAASNFASTFVDYAVDSIGRSIKEKGTEIWNALFGMDFSKDAGPESGGLFFTKNPLELIPGVDGLLDGMFGGIEKGLKWAWEGICGWFTGEAHAAELGGEVGTLFSDGYNDSLNNGKEKTVNTANEIGTGISEGIVSKLESMDASQLQLLQTELTNLQTTTQTVATGMGTSFTQIQNSARTSFMGLTNIVRNQMLNVSNIIRNQLLNCTNIVRNQALNMANAFREQFVNMSNIANNQFMNVANNIRTQMVNCTNIVRNQALSMANIFRNQFVNMANIARNQFLNVANIVRNQMTNCTNIVRNQTLNMSNIFRNQFVNMANIVRNQMTNCTNIIRNQCVNMSNIFRNQFVNMANIVRNQMTNCTNIIRNQCVNMANIFRNQFVNMANIARNQFVNVANIVRNQMTNCANIVRNQCVNMANIFRNQFVSMANVARNQMVNISNIIRNQAVNWSNIIRNQVTNARNALTQQMLSMAAVTRTQMVNITNIIRNQSTQWASLVQSGASRAKSSFSSSFSGLASVARSQMANCLSIVRSYMNQIAAATSKTMTMNFKVNKSVTTTNITKNVTQGARATMGNINTNMRGIAQPSTMSTSMSNGSINLAPANNGISGSLALEVPLFLDGREIARASASYTQAELAKLEMRGNRKRGN